MRTMGHGPWTIGPQADIGRHRPHNSSGGSGRLGSALMPHAQACFGLTIRYVRAGVEAESNHL